MLLFLLPIVLLGVGGILSSHQAFQLLLARERTEVQLDNAAIRLGRGLRTALRQLETDNQELARLENGHHLVHACAKTKQPHCIAADKAAELVLLQRAWMAKVRFQGRCLPLLSQVLGEGRGARVQLLAIRLWSSNCALRGVRCSVCRLRARWEVASPPEMELRSAAPHAGAGLGVRWRRQGVTWDYQILPRKRGE